jgi:hypothetical protein
MTHGSVVRHELRGTRGIIKQSNIQHSFTVNGLYMRHRHYILAANQNINVYTHCSFKVLLFQFKAWIEGECTVIRWRNLTICTTDYIQEVWSSTPRQASCFRFLVDSFLFLWLYRPLWTLASLMILLRYSYQVLSPTMSLLSLTLNLLRQYQATLIWVFAFSESLQAARMLSFCKVSFPPFWLKVLAILSWLSHRLSWSELYGITSGVVNYFHLAAGQVIMKWLRTWRLRKTSSVVSRQLKHRLNIFHRDITIIYITC